MSKAFVKEEDDQWLNEIPPTMGSLIAFLRKENNGIRIYELRNYMHPQTGREVHEMSNGLSYAIGDDDRWRVVEQ